MQDKRQRKAYVSMRKGDGAKFPQIMREMHGRKPKADGGSVQDYLNDRADDHDWYKRAFHNAAAINAAAGAAMLIPPNISTIVKVPAALANAGLAASNMYDAYQHGEKAERARSASDKWRRTGLPDRPGKADGGEVDRRRQKIQAYTSRGLEPPRELMEASDRRLTADEQRAEERVIGTGIVEATGVPTMIEGVGNVVGGVSDGDYTRAGLGAIQTGVGAMPGASLFRAGRAAMAPLFSSATRGAAFSGATQLPSAVFEARDAAAQAKAEDIAAKLRSMNADQLRAYQQAIGVTPDGRLGPETIGAAIRFEDKASREADTRRQLEMEAVRAKGEADKEAARIRAQAEAEGIRAKQAADLATQEKERAAKTPIRDLYPEVMPFMPVVTGALAGGLGGMVRGSYQRAYNTKMGDLTSRWQNAVRSGDKALAEEIGKRVASAQTAGPGGMLPAVASGAVLGGKVAVLPEEIDLWRGTEGAWERATDVPTMLKRAGTGALIGGGAAFTGAEVQNARLKRDFPDYSAETKAMPSDMDEAVARALRAVENRSALTRAEQAAKRAAELDGVLPPLGSTSTLTGTGSSRATGRSPATSGTQGQVSPNGRKALPAPPSSATAPNPTQPVVSPEPPDPITQRVFSKLDRPYTPEHQRIAQDYLAKKLSSVPANKRASFDLDAGRIEADLADEFRKAGLAPVDGAKLRANIANTVNIFRDMRNQNRNPYAENALEFMTGRKGTLGIAAGAGMGAAAATADREERKDGGAVAACRSMKSDKDVIGKAVRAARKCGGRVKKADGGLVDHWSWHQPRDNAGRWR